MIVAFFAKYEKGLNAVFTGTIPWNVLVYSELHEDDGPPDPYGVRPHKHGKVVQKRPATVNDILELQATYGTIVCAGGALVRQIQAESVIDVNLQAYGDRGSIIVSRFRQRTEPGVLPAHEHYYVELPVHEAIARWDQIDEVEAKHLLISCNCAPAECEPAEADVGVSNG